MLPRWPTEIRSELAPQRASADGADVWDQELLPLSASVTINMAWLSKDRTLIEVSHGHT